MGRPNRFELWFASAALIAITLIGPETGAADGRDSASATNQAVHYGSEWFDIRYRSELASLRHYASKTAAADGLAKLAALRARVNSRFGAISLESAAVIAEQGHAFVLSGDYGKAEQNYIQVVAILQRISHTEALRPVANETGHSKAETNAGGLAHASKQKLSELLAEITSRYRNLGLMADALMSELFNKSAFPKSSRDWEAVSSPQVPIPERAVANIDSRSGGALDREPPESSADPAAEMARLEDRRAVRRKTSVPKRRAHRRAQRVFRHVAPPDPYEYRYEPRPYYPYDSSRYWRPLRSARR